jgi:hypothetical protein
MWTDNVLKLYAILDSNDGSSFGKLQVRGITCFTFFKTSYYICHHWLYVHSTFSSWIFLFFLALLLMSYSHYFFQMKHPCSTPFGYRNMKCNISYNLPLDVVSFIERTYNLEEQKKVRWQFFFLEFIYLFVIWYLFHVPCSKYYGFLQFLNFVSQ